MTISGILEVGDVYPASILVTDTTGAAANAGACALTITLPDLTTVVPTVTNTPTGTYFYDYTTTQAGRHIVLWVLTGANGGTIEDSFYVEARPSQAIVGLSETKAYLNLTRTDLDDKVRSWIIAASSAVESYCNRDFTPKPITTIFSGGDTLDALVMPRDAVSITSVVENGTTLAATDYVLDPAGSVLYRRIGTYYTRWWLVGTMNITVTYTVGSNIIPATIRHATLAMIRELWDDSQRGAPSGSNPRSSDVYDQAGLFLFTPLVRSLLDNYRLPGFA